ncbi:MAG: SUMF1/EgtB/PvdO family nonheme iron enzyme [Acidobacteriota bacterium]
MPWRTAMDWYEAAAYAEFAGKSLPTVYHWRHAAGLFQAAHIAPFCTRCGTA